MKKNFIFLFLCGVVISVSAAQSSRSKTTKAEIQGSIHQVSLNRNDCFALLVRAEENLNALKNAQERTEEALRNFFAARAARQVRAVLVELDNKPSFQAVTPMQHATLLSQIDRCKKGVAQAGRAVEQVQEKLKIFDDVLSSLIAELA